MKRKLLLAASAIALLFSGLSAQRWNAKNPFTDGSFPETDSTLEVFSMSAPSANVAWASLRHITAGSPCQSIALTIDGGKTWKLDTVQKIAGFNAKAYDFGNVFGWDKDVAWAALYNATAGSGGLIAKTTNGGLTWTKQTTTAMFSSSNTTSRPFLDFVHFFDANTGVAVGDPTTPTGTTGVYYEIYTTTNGGTTWTLVSKDSIPAPLTGEAATVDLYSVKGNSMWFGTNKGRIFYSNDKGHNWNVSTNKVGNVVHNVEFADANHGLANQGDSLYGSSDGGKTWTLLNTVTSGKIDPIKNYFSFGDIKAIPGTHDFVSCGRYQADPTSKKATYGSAFSRDYGKTWIKIGNDLKYHDTLSYNVMAFVDSLHGYAGGFKKANFYPNTRKVIPPDTTANIVVHTLLYTFDINADISSARNLSVKELTTYPNPVVNTLNISAGSNLGSATFAIYNSLGSLVASYKATGAGLNQLDVSSLSPGVYIVQTQDKESIYRTKFIKE